MKVKTFNDLYVKGRTEPVLHRYLTLWQNGEISKEDMLVNMVMTLVEQKNEVTENFTNHLMKCDKPAIIR